MLRERFVRRIDAEGPVPFEDFMATCLYDERAGFFATGPLRSVKSGDFLTSPEVSPWFGRAIAKYVESAVAAGSVVVDVGAGSGSLLQPLIDRLGDAYDYHAVEVSPAAREALAAFLGRDAIHTTMASLPEPLHGIVVANELLDNLPVALAVRSSGAWEERWVGAEGDHLDLVAVPARPEVATWCDDFAGTVPEGGMMEVQLEATAWVSSVLRRLESGTLVAIDYGGTAEELEPRRTQGTLRTYRAHHLGPDPLVEPGATDITVDVNFTALAAAAAAAEGVDVKIMRQDDFLSDLGLRDVVSDLRRRELDLTRAGEEMERLTVRSERIDLETLLHPRGLGDFRVLVAQV